MVRLNRFENQDKLINELEMNRIYPLSIAEDFQKGEIFADNAENPNALLFWHYCGFAYLAGRYDEQFLNEILDMMHHPTENHRNRLVLHTNNDDRLSQLILKNKDIKRKERYCFEYAEKNLFRFSKHHSDLFALIPKIMNFSAEILRLLFPGIQRRIF